MLHDMISARPGKPPNTVTASYAGKTHAPGCHSTVLQVGCNMSRATPKVPACNLHTIMLWDSHVLHGYVPAHPSAGTQLEAHT